MIFIYQPKEGVEDDDLRKDITSHFILRLAFCGKYAIFLYPIHLVSYINELFFPKK